MITILKLKKNFYSLIGITSLTIFSQTTWAANPVADCAVSGAGVVTQIMDGAGGFDCFAQPDSQKVKFYKVMLCTSAYNGAVTDALGPNTFLGDCTTLYESTAGDEVNVLGNIAAGIADIQIKIGGILIEQVGQGLAFSHCRIDGSAFESFNASQHAHIIQRF